MDKRTFLKGMAVLAASPSIRGNTLASLGRPVGNARRPLAAWPFDEWSLNVDVLESCSCPVFCQCFFTDKPPASEITGPGNMSGMQHVCRFIQAYRVNTGHSGSVGLDGVRFWFAGDAGDDFDKPKLEWAMLTFDSGMSREQRDALLGVLRHLHWYRPDRWKSYSIGEDAPIEWSADEHGAHATLGGGAIAEIALSTMVGQHHQPVTVSNLPYFGYPRNTGFTLMPSTVLAYRRGARAFEYKDKGTNGLLTTLDMNARDFAGKS